MRAMYTKRPSCKECFDTFGPPDTKIDGKNQCEYCRGLLVTRDVEVLQVGTCLAGDGAVVQFKDGTLHAVLLSELVVYGIDWSTGKDFTSYGADRTSANAR